MLSYRNFAWGSLNCSSSCWAQCSLSWVNEEFHVLPRLGPSVSLRDRLAQTYGSWQRRVSQIVPTFSGMCALLFKILEDISLCFLALLQSVVRMRTKPPCGDASLPWVGGTMNTGAPNFLGESPGRVARRPCPIHTTFFITVHVSSGSVLSRQPSRLGALGRLPKFFKFLSSYV